MRALRKISNMLGTIAVCEPAHESETEKTNEMENFTETQ